MSPHPPRPRRPCWTHHRLTPLLLLLVAAATGAPAQDLDTENATFHRVQLSYGITLDVPATWVALPDDTRQRVSERVTAVMKKAGLEPPDQRKSHSLLALNAAPSPAGALIRVTITSPPDYSPADLAAMTPEKLKDIGSELRGVFDRIEAAGGPRITDVQDVRTDTLNGYPALVISYTRAGRRNPGPWQVTQYKMPVSNQLIQISFAYHQAEAAKWQPIMARIRKSVHF